MLAWFRKRREAGQRAVETAERLLRELGDAAYSEARRCEREALDDETAADWRRVALAVARRPASKSEPTRQRGCMIGSEGLARPSSDSLGGR